LLPKYRGAAPIHRVIINGEQDTGVTTMLMDTGLDTGDILLREKVSIPLDMNCGELHDILAQKGATLLLQTVEDWLNNRIKAVKQDTATASYAAILKREDELINWNKTAIKIYNQIRGLDPWPGGYTTYENKPLKIRAAKLCEIKNQTDNPGTVLDIVKGKGFVVQTGEGGILVEKVQPFGKNIISADSFINGYSLKKGHAFSDV
jgi:methionyl-tRNA formyltransferase